MSETSVTSPSADSSELSESVTSQDSESISQTTAKLDTLTVSPPSYSVRETREGEFYNTTLDLAWPNRPQEGYYSKNEYYKRKGEMINIKLNKWLENFENSFKKDDNCTSLLHPDYLAENSFNTPRWFLGQVSPITAAEKIKPVQCAVFYPLIEPDLSDIPQNLQPILVYKNQENEVYFFEIEFNMKTDMWYLQFPKNFKTPGFARLKQLIEYISTTGYLSPKGLLELLPVWEVDKYVSI